MLQSALQYKEFESERQVPAVKVSSTATRFDDLLTLKDRPSRAALHDVGGSLVGDLRATEIPKYVDNGTIKPLINRSQANIPSYFDGWQAKVEGLAGARMNSIHESKYLASSSPAVAPSAMEQAACSSTGFERPVLFNTQSRSAESSTSDCLTIPHSENDTNSQSVQNRRFLPTKTVAAEQLSPLVASGMPSRITTLFSDDNISSSDPIEHSNAISRARGAEACRNEKLISTSGFKIPESPGFSWPTILPSERDMANRNGAYDETELHSSKADRMTLNDSVSPVKKLCGRCQRLILGPTSMCTKCQQTRDDGRPDSSTENLGMKHLRPVKSLTEVVAFSRKDLCLSCGLEQPCLCHLQESSPHHPGKEFSCKDKRDKGLAIDKSHVEDNMTIPAKHNQATLPGSPVIPETPDLVSEKTYKNGRILIETAKSAAAHQTSSKSLVPQKRPMVRSTASDNDHCFSKKKARIFKPTVKSIAVNVPPTSLYKFPPTPKSGSPFIEHKSRDTSLQAHAETAHRGRSPSLTPHEGIERLEITAQGPDSPAVQSDRTTAQHENVPVVDSATFGASPVSIIPGGKLQQGQLKRHTQKLLKQKSREFDQRVQEFESAEAAIARLRRPVQEIAKPPSQDSSAPGGNSCRAECDAENVTHDGINSHIPVFDTSCNGTSRNEEMVLQVLRNRGVVFEEDCSSGSDVDMPLPKSKTVPKNPLWRPPQSSMDLFLIAPGLNPAHSSFDVERKIKEIEARPPRKKRRRTIKYLRHERGDNVHEEIQRTFHPPIVKTSYNVRAGFGESVELNVVGTGAEQRETTFSDFIGAPARPMAILTTDKQLAFRDGTRDSKGDLPRAREKFLVTNKSVGCMEI